MKCIKCKGTGVREDKYGFTMYCPDCHGKGEYEPFDVDIELDKLDNEPMTNKEYMHTCRDDELVALLCKLVDSGILQKWRIKYHCSDSDEDAVRMWLKEKHDEM